MLFERVLALQFAALEPKQVAPELSDAFQTHVFTPKQAALESNSARNAAVVLQVCSYGCRVS